MKKASGVAIIVTHRLFTGAGQELYRYLKNRNNAVLLVEHSFMAYPNRRTTFSFFDTHIETVKEGWDYKLLPDLLCYGKDFFYSLSVVLRYPLTYTTYFGCGGFNVLPGLLLKLLGRVDKVVFYSIDFSRQRFSNSFLNRIYMLVDKLCVTLADQTWNLNQRMAQGRQEYNNIPQALMNKQVVVPIGVWLQDFSQIREMIIFEKKLIFCGDLSESQGLQLVFESIPEIVKKVPGFKFQIVGDGYYKEALITLANTLGVSSHIEFLGPIYDQKRLFTVLSAARAGIAPYKDSAALTRNAYFADATKPKTYLSCGLPVVITAFPDISTVIKERALGIVIQYTRDEVIDAVVKLLTDDAFYTQCKMRIQEFIWGLDWNKIFQEALQGVEGV